MRSGDGVSAAFSDSDDMGIVESMAVFESSGRTVTIVLWVPSADK